MKRKFYLLITCFFTIIFTTLSYASIADAVIRGVGVGVRNGSYISESNDVEAFAKNCNDNSIQSYVNKDDIGSDLSVIDKGYTITFEVTPGNFEEKEVVVGRILYTTINCGKNTAIVTLDYRIDSPIFPMTKFVACSEDVVFDPLPEPLFQSNDQQIYTPFESRDTIYRGDCSVEYIWTYGQKSFIPLNEFKYTFDNDGFINDPETEKIPAGKFEYIVYTVKETIIQKDDSAPTFSQVPTTATIKCNNYPDDQMINQVTAQDDCGTVTISFTDSRQPDCSQTTTVVRTWTATDACGQSTTAQTVITVLSSEEEPPASACEAVTLINVGLINQLVIDNVIAPNAILTVFKISDFGHLRLVWSCSTTCFPQNLLTLETGNYRVNIRFYDERWRSICETDKEIFIGEEEGGDGDDGGGINGGNGDGGDDGENNGDGNTTDLCNGVQITTTNKYISIDGFGGDGVETKVFDANWNRVFTCAIGECADPIQVDNVNTGQYFIIFKRYKVGQFGSLTLVCDELVEVMVGAGVIAPLIAATTQKQLPQLKDFQISPNPANDYIYLGLRKYRGEAVEIQMYHQLGNPVLKRSIEEVKDDLEYIPLTDFDNGVYFLQIHNPRYRAITQRVVITRMY